MRDDGKGKKEEGRERGEGITINPRAVLLALKRASFKRVIIPAKIGVDALVPSKNK